MTAMKIGVYALLAVVVGVMLVGFIPGQISNLATPAKTEKTFSIPAPTKNLTGNASQVTILNNTASPNKDGGTDTGVNETRKTAGSATSATQAASANANQTSDITHTRIDPYSEVRYYSFWVVGFLVALVAYFISKRQLN